MFETKAGTKPEPKPLFETVRHPGFKAKKRLLRAFPFPLLRTASILRMLPFHAFVTLEASHANAHARAIAFFSYIRLKYDILILHCCKLRNEVVTMLSFQPSALGFDSRLSGECVMQYAGTGKEMHEAFFFCSKPCITVRVGAAMPA